MDLFSLIVTSFLAIGLISLGVAVVSAYFLNRWFRGLPPRMQTMVFAFLVLGGLVAIVSVIGAEIGVTFILLSIFLQIFKVLQPAKTG